MTWMRALADSPGWPSESEPVSAAVESARVALGRLNGPRGIRDRTGRVAAAASMRAARASAAIDGSPLVLDRAVGTIADPVLAGAVRVAAALGSVAGTWRRAPLQALAKLHTLAAADLVPPQDLGRPRVDPQRSVLVGDRLAVLAELVVRPPWPAPVVVAVVHGELASLAPFGCADGVVARAAARLTMITTGLDPSGVALPEVAHLRSVAEYRAGVRGFVEGGRSGLDEWVILVCEAMVRGAVEGRALAAAVKSDEPGERVRTPLNWAARSPCLCIQ